MFSTEQLAVAKALRSGPKSLEDLKTITSLDEARAKTAIDALITLKLVEQDASGAYKLIERVSEKVKERFLKTAFRAWMVFEAAANTEDGLKKYCEVFEKRLAAEPFKIFSLKKSEISDNAPAADAEQTTNIMLTGQSQAQGSETALPAFSMFFELDVGVPRFSDLIYLISSYGPSCVEVLEPREYRFSQSELQEALNGFASAIHYYAGVVAKGIPTRN